MRRLIPAMILTFCGTAAFSQTSTSRNSDTKATSFAESLRQEIISDIKKKISSDTAMQRSQETLNDFYKACGVQHSDQKVTTAPQTSRVYKVAPENVAVVISDRKGS